MLWSIGYHTSLTHRSWILELAHLPQMLYQLHHDRHLAVPRRALRRSTEVAHRLRATPRSHRIHHDRYGHHLRVVRPESGVEPRDGVQGAKVVRDRQVLHRRGAAGDGFEERLRTADRGGLEEVCERDAGQWRRVLS